MKSVKIIFITAFFLILAFPIITFNRKENAISEIDNKVLAENPLRKNHEDINDLTNELEIYVSERVGFRNQMILAYTIANDKIFNEMVHPTYMYGKDGYVFFKSRAVRTYGDFENAFANVVYEIQKYCDARDIAFVFVFEPSKTSILQDKLPEGYIYNNDWVDPFFDQLNEYGINYVDNSEIMQKCTEKGVQVFNVKYNAGHWNDLGAYYGMNSVLNYLNQLGVNVHANELDEFIITKKLNTTLQASEFPIYEYEPIFMLNNKYEIDDITDKFKDNIELDPNYQHFKYYINRRRKNEGAPKTLVFQGSYINGMGYKFLQNSLGEYIAIHDYQNVLNFEYYMNIFQPECVIFEVAEYTFSNRYFDYKEMQSFNLPPLLDSFDNFTEVNISGDFEISAGEVTTKIKLSNVEVECDYAYLIANNIEYNMQGIINSETEDTCYKVVLNNEYFKDIDTVDVILVDKDAKIKYIIDG